MGKKREFKPLVIGATTAIVAAIGTVGIMSSVVVPAYTEAKTAEIEKDAQKLKEVMQAASEPEESSVAENTEAIETNTYDMNAYDGKTYGTNAYDDGQEPEDGLVLKDFEEDPPSVSEYVVEPDKEETEIAEKISANKSDKSGRLNSVVTDIANMDTGTTEVVKKAVTVKEAVDDSDVSVIKKLTLKSRVSKVEKNYKKLKKAMTAALNAYVRSDKKATEKLQKKMTKNATALSKAKKKLDAAVLSLDTNSKDVEGLKTKLEEYSKSAVTSVRVDQMKNEILASVNDAKYVSKDELAALESLVNKSQKLTDTEIENLKKLINQGQSDSTKSQVSNVSGESTDTVTGLTTLKEAFYKYINDNDANIKELKDNSTAQGKSIDELKTESKQQKEEISSIKSTADSQKEAIDAIKSTADSQKEAIDAIKSDADSQRETINAISGNIQQVLSESLGDCTLSYKNGHFYITYSEGGADSVSKKLD